MTALLSREQILQALDALADELSRRDLQAKLILVGGGAMSFPDDWLNDGAKGFLVGFAEGAKVYDRPSLVVLTPAPQQLLAMKLSAGRIGVDYADVVVLLSKVSGSKEDVWAALEPHLIPGHQLKAQYIFEDLWEETHEAH